MNNKGTPYSLAGSTIGLAAGATANVNVLIDGDYDFVDGMWCGAALLNAIVANVGIAGTPFAEEPNPSPAAAANNTMPSAWLILVQVELNGEKFFDAEVPLPTIFGSAKEPFIPLDRRVFRANSNIKFSFRNAGLTAADVRFAIHGRKIPRGSAA